MKQHLLTIASVIGLVLAAAVCGLMPAQAFNGNGGGGGGGSGTVHSVAAVGLGVYYSALNAVSGLTGHIHVYPYLSSNSTDPIQAALSALPQVAWPTSTVEAVGNVIADSNGDTEYVVAINGTDTTGSTAPTWPPSSVANVGTITYDCTSGTCGSGNYTVKWEMVAVGSYAPSQDATVILDETTTPYSVPSAVIIGSGLSTGHQVHLVNNGATVNCTDSGGAGHACIVLSQHGLYTGNKFAYTSAPSPASIDAVIESESAYLDRLPTNPFVAKQTNFDLRGFQVTASGTIAKALVWLDGIEGQGLIRDGYFNSGPTGATQLLINDNTQAWNGLLLENLWLGMGNATTGLDVECGTHGGSNLQFLGSKIVDPNSAGSPIWFEANGSVSAACIGLQIENTYFEGDTASNNTGTGLLLNRVQAANITSVYFNTGGSYTQSNCVSITGSASGIHVDGRAITGVCTDVINNAVNSEVITTTGSVTYDYGLRHRNQLTVATLPATCNPGDTDLVKDWSGNVGACMGGGSSYGMATCGASNNWFCGASATPVATGASLGTGVTNGTVTSSTAGADTVSLSSGNLKLTMTANESNAGCTAASTPDACCTGSGTGSCGLTIQEGTLPITASATQLWPVQIEICQQTPGNFQLAFLAGTSVSNIYWSGGSQPGYTLTAGNGDVYSCSYNGANLYCSQRVSNVPCM